MSVRVLAILPIILALLASCGYEKVEYFYFDFDNGEVDLADWQEPEVWFYRGEKVPVKTKFDWNGKTLQILNVNDCCVPFLEVRSPVPLSNMIITNGEFVSDYDDLHGASCVGISREAGNTVQLYWLYWPDDSAAQSCIHVGDEIQIELVPEDGSESLVLSAELVRSGHYWISDL